jgi:hypothetical protein
LSCLCQLFCQSNKRPHCEGPKSALI